MKIAISSGKGGTGKTFIATNMAAVLAEQSEAVTYIDCDVEEPNGHLFLKPVIDRKETMTVRAPISFDQDLCMGCGKCAEACNYNALAVVRGKVLLFGELCHACGACSIVCPVGAVVEGDKEIGTLLHGKSGLIEFHYGLLKTAVGGMSPRLIAGLKTRAGSSVTVLDSPPGTACSAVETIKGADLCVLVADPTPFAIHDLKLSVNMARQVGQEPVVVVNRAGLDDRALKGYCTEGQLEVIGEIPDDRRIAEVYSVGDLVTEKLPEYEPLFRNLIRRALALAGQDRTVKSHLIEPPFVAGGPLTRAKTPDVAAQKRPDEIVVISGKGGTGKTSLAACFAQLAEEAVVSDCDVDASDLHLILNPEVLEEGDFSGGVSAKIELDKCTQCGKCMEACRFRAIVRDDNGHYLIDETACEGCGVCGLVCGDNAVTLEDALNGKWFISNTRFGPMSHAILGYAEENSGRLVTVVRQFASDLAQEATNKRVDSDGSQEFDKVLIDGAPGTGCPVIASISGAQYAVVVTEPTVSGLHDFERILDLTRHFGIQTGVIINKCDLNNDMTERISAAASLAAVALLGVIPYDQQFTEAQILRKTLLEHADGYTKQTVLGIWQKIRSAVHGS